MTYLAGRVSTLKMHIDLTEQRRRHADEDGLKGSDGQMGNAYWDKKSGGCLEGWDILWSLINPPPPPGKPPTLSPVYTFKYTDSTNMYIKMIENLSGLFKCTTGMRANVGGDGWQPKKKEKRSRWERETVGQKVKGQMATKKKTAWAKAFWL